MISAEGDLGLGANLTDIGCHLCRRPCREQSVAHKGYVVHVSCLVQFAARLRAQAEAARAAAQEARAWATTALQTAAAVREKHR